MLPLMIFTEVWVFWTQALGAKRSSRVAFTTMVAAAVRQLKLAKHFTLACVGDCLEAVSHSKVVKCWLCLQ